jgi:hypothetical protein
MALELVPRATYGPGESSGLSISPGAAFNQRRAKRSLCRT